MVSEWLGLKQEIYVKTSTGWQQRYVIKPKGGVRGHAVCRIALNDHHYRQVSGSCAHRRVVQLACQHLQQGTVNNTDVDHQKQVAAGTFDEDGDQTFVSKVMQCANVLKYIFTSQLQLYAGLVEMVLNVAYEQRTQHDLLAAHVMWRHQEWEAFRAAMCVQVGWHFATRTWRAVPWRAMRRSNSDVPDLLGGSQQSEALAQRALFVEDYEWDTLEHILRQLDDRGQARMNQRMILLGGICRRGHLLSAATARHPHLLVYLGAFLRHHSSCEARWTAVAINRGRGVRPHFDAGNLGSSRIMTFGNNADVLRLHFQGELRRLHTYHRVVPFNSYCTHSTYSEVPDRYAVVFYTPRARTLERARRELRAMNVDIGGGGSSDTSTEPYLPPILLQPRDVHLLPEHHGSVRSPEVIFMSGWVTLHEATVLFGVEELMLTPLSG